MLVKRKWLEARAVKVSEVVNRWGRPSGQDKKEQSKR